MNSKLSKEDPKHRSCMERRFEDGTNMGKKKTEEKL